MSHFTVTHEKESEKPLVFDHIPAQGPATLNRTLDFVAKIDEGLRYQYYVTELDGDEDNADIISQANADVWLEEHKNARYYERIQKISSDYQGNQR